MDRTGRFKIPLHVAQLICSKDLLYWSKGLHPVKERKEQLVHHEICLGSNIDQTSVRLGEVLVAVDVAQYGAKWEKWSLSLKAGFF